MAFVGGREQRVRSGRTMSPLKNRSKENPAGEGEGTARTQLAAWGAGKKLRQKTDMRT